MFYEFYPFFVGQTENWPLSSTITEPLVWDNAPGKGDYKMLRIQVSDFTYMYWLNMVGYM